MTTPAPPAGWHPDPEGRSQLRWWDGSQWTSATKPRAIQEGPKDPPPPIDPKVRKRNNLIAVGAIAAVAVGLIGFSVFAANDESSTASSSRETTTESTTTTTTAAATTTTTRSRPPAAYVPPVVRTTTTKASSIDSSGAPLFIAALNRLDFPNEYGNDYLYLQAIYVCASLDEGKTFVATGAGLLESNPEWTPEQAGQLAGIAIGAFCDQHEGKIPGR